MPCLPELPREFTPPSEERFYRAVRDVGKEELNLLSTSLEESNVMGGLMPRFRRRAEFLATRTGTTIVLPNTTDSDRNTIAEVELALGSAGCPKNGDIFQKSIPPMDHTIYKIDPNSTPQETAAD